MIKITDSMPVLKLRALLGSSSAREALSIRKQLKPWGRDRIRAMRNTPLPPSPRPVPGFPSGGMTPCAGATAAQVRHVSNIVRSPTELQPPLQSAAPAGPAAAWSPTIHGTSTPPCGPSRPDDAGDERTIRNGGACHGAPPAHMHSASRLPRTAWAGHPDSDAASRFSDGGNEWETWSDAAESDSDTTSVFSDGGNEWEDWTDAHLYSLADLSALAARHEREERAMRAREAALPEASPPADARPVKPVPPAKPAGLREGFEARRAARLALTLAGEPVAAGRPVNGPGGRAVTLTGVPPTLRDTAAGKGGRT